MTQVNLMRTISLPQYCQNPDCGGLRRDRDEKMYTANHLEKLGTLTNKADLGVVLTCNPSYTGVIGRRTEVQRWPGQKPYLKNN
jgi:hypothetical protein